MSDLDWKNCSTFAEYLERALASGQWQEVLTSVKGATDAKWELYRPILEAWATLEIARGSDANVASFVGQLPEGRRASFREVWKRVKSAKQQPAPAPREGM